MQSTSWQYNPLHICVMHCRAKGMACCQALDGVLDEYVQKKREGRIYVHHGLDDANQHGFMVPFGT